ncbi:putative hydrolase of the HAD superfamily [Aequitasia blattaphilus]|uniref:HAD-IA family hydrolase n=1 Tax=Aequitasia blattaphilus TaxID=2949332 RepID=A0ABT1EAW2_9FIRM|nr:HAD-IA family hydrolase [Aequitasia blattaphilus]MCP1102970.1 HAD-IA family hydrolase [Aequitasia blattaphilus]MCR8615610.1 HAD-IA family hydrolase [Aequitasia blattaphilus]
MIKAVVFDIDNTMYDYDGGNEIALQKVSRYCKEKIGLSERDFYEKIKRAQEMVEERTGIQYAASHNRLLRFQCLLELLNRSSFSMALTMYQIYWDTLIEDMKPEPGLLDFIKELKSQGILVGVGTDMTAYIQYRKLEKLGVLEDMDMILTSEEAGIEKPSEKFFELCVKKLGCKPCECVFIGDNLERDVKGSIESGLRGIWYKPANQSSQYETIENFKECLKGGRNEII